MARQVVSTGGSQPHKFVLVFRGQGTLMVRYYCVPQEGSDGECNLTFQGASVRVDTMGAVLLKGAALAVMDDQ